MNINILPIEKAIIDKIEKLRRDKGQTQYDLAAGIGVDRSFISKAATYKSSYNFEHINKIAIHFNCKLHDLVPEYPIRQDETADE